MLKMFKQILRLQSRKTIFVSQTMLESFVEHRADDLLSNRVSQGVRDCGRANAKFCCNVLFLPTLQIKLNNLHVHGLKRFQWYVIGRGHGVVVLSNAL